MAGNAFSGRARLARAFLVLVVVAFVAGVLGDDAAAQLHAWGQPALDKPAHTHVWTIRYRSHTGRTRLAYVLLPSWYGPDRHPPIPLVISPHGRGMNGRTNLKLWGDLPAIGSFAVVNPDGEGDHLDAYSWGAPGQIDDLAKMPAFVSAELPWLQVDPRRVYAVGGSMGGQETLLLLGRYPQLLAGAAAFDSVVDFAHQYGEFPRLGCNERCRSRLGAPLGRVLQRMARTEIGGDPAEAPAAYAARSPVSFARAIASSCVPLQLWWSSQDRIVVDPQHQSGGLPRGAGAAEPGSAGRGNRGNLGALRRDGSQHPPSVRTRRLRPPARRLQRLLGPRRNQRDTPTQPRLRGHLRQRQHPTRKAWRFARPLPRLGRSLTAWASPSHSDRTGRSTREKEIQVKARTFILTAGATLALAVPAANASIARNGLYQAQVHTVLAEKSQVYVLTPTVCGCAWPRAMR